jgi:hypothetical protein
VLGQKEAVDFWPLAASSKNCGNYVFVVKFGWRGLGLYQERIANS